ncbi:hypothetical protein AB1Y20_002525 [Prymnesium parvum]|uniref:SET domain-containing protein n=1 Tax=Prymnesium parvum TaxID=97485 RepID=A0AB34JBB1_PRYPA
MSAALLTSTLLSAALYPLSRLLACPPPPPLLLLTRTPSSRASLSSCAATPPAPTSKTPLDASRVAVRSAGVAGLGAFTVDAIAAGAFVCSYAGTLLTRREVWARYVGEPAEYLFGLTADLSIDAQSSHHYSRFFNHHENGTLHARVPHPPRAIHFYASRDICPGEELTFDYGMSYWLWRDKPSPHSDSRWSRLEGPMTAAKFQAMLARSEEESCRALRRYLSHCGGFERSGGRDRPLEASAHAELQAAAAECFARSLARADSSGALSEAFLAWVASADAELRLIRRWRGGMAPFPSARREAVALTIYLLWRCPKAHHVHLPLQADVCRRMVARLQRGDDPSDLSAVWAVLEKHAPTAHTRKLSAMLQSWIEETVP